MSKVRNPYQSWEISVIQKYYPTEGPKGVMKRGVRRTERAIIVKANTLGVLLTQKAMAEIRREKALINQNLLEAKGCIDPKPLPDEYIQVRDIFTVGYLYAKQFGIVKQILRHR